ncbi:MAG: thermonuclease family protein, partial [Alphaproteobacteria bacterium]|nr:thermonuclease family protein [Alphaproteobacteria bacterium]
MAARGCCAVLYDYGDCALVAAHDRWGRRSMFCTPRRAARFRAGLLVRAALALASGIVVYADALPACAETITGRASIIDGDTLEIHGQRIRLHGIDAPENGQSCEAGGSPYRCGRRAALALDDLIAGRTVACERTDTDRYGRAVAICTVAGADLGRRMVEAGWALAYRKYAADYIDAEDGARAGGAGLWAGTFVAPWDYRAGVGSASEPAASGGCVIKGNISSSGER